MNSQEFEKMKEEISKDVVSYCWSYVRHCYMGISDEKILSFLKDCEIGDIRALLGYLAVDYVSKMEDWPKNGEFVRANIVGLCKESVKFDNSSNLKDEDIPLLTRLTKISNNDFYYARGRISSEAVSFLANVKVFGKV